MTCYKILLQKGTLPAIELILEKAFPFLLFILLLAQVISACMIIKKQAVHLFTLLKIWKPVLGYFMDFNSACDKSQDIRYLQFNSFVAKTPEAACRH